ncbi:LysR family transcriptional regulator [Paeniglutamicibacter cryotolerans]|uniref:DNA-binding transcriptional LysR family regulator n=1 Tax=Paeniglutamicibacter cryotolerans TaxID=670079 RepID=A0A839QLG8_9MICC|nr:LysR family transcriptional regulator [Paeniglutamicibacter cryotolerans]MBB2997069.1 DNA-binding transcriptional LysR family regulator [Paeniglutamicibacter cryotolerans]
MSRFTLRQLELFCVLPDHPTLSSAAKALHVSESALSHAISGLEAAVGEQLCIRRKARGMHLTTAGRHFAERARGILRDLEVLANELAEVSGELRGPVALGCYTGLASNVLPAVLEGIGRLHPGVDISITVGDHADLLPALENGTLDTAIVYDIGMPPELERTTIYETEVMAVLAESDPLAAQPDVDLADLVPEPLILLDTAPSTGYTQLMFDQRGLVPRLGAKVPQIDLARAMVGRGLGYSLIMSRPNQIPVSSEGLPLASRRLRPRSGQTNVVAIWPADTRPTARARAVIDYAIQTLEAVDPG